MPKPKENYSNGKIYKIISNNPDITDIYYGSTKQLLLSYRMSGHRASYKNYLNGKDSSCTSFFMFDKYGIDQFHIELVEDYSCQTKKDLLIRENWYIKNMECINKRAAHTTKEEVVEKKRQHYLDHKEEHLEQMRQRREEHKEEMNEYNRQYREEHKEEINEKQLQNYHANKETINEKKKEKIVCDCGRTVRKSDIAAHRKSAIHLANI